MKRLVVGLTLVAVIAAAAYRFRGNNRGESTAPATDANTPASPTTVTVATARRSPARRSITLTGVVRADRQAVVTAKMPSAIVAVSVKAGDQVIAGQVLVRLDGRDAAGQLANAQAGIAAAEAQYRKAIDGKRARTVEMDSRITEARNGLTTALAKLKQAELAVVLTASSASSDTDRASAGVKQAEAGLRQAQAGLSQADDLVKRLRFLYAHGGVAQADLEGAESQAEIAKAQRDAAVAALDQARALAKPTVETSPLRKKISEADLAAARSGVDQAVDGLKAARKARIEALRISDRDVEAAFAQLSQAKVGKSLAVTQAGSTTLTSPMNGVVTEVNARSGEIAQPGMPLVTVVSPDSVYVEASLPVKYAGRVRVGDSATVFVDTMPNSPLRTDVGSVVPAASDDSRSLSVRLSIKDGSKQTLIPGVLARIDLPLSSNQNAVSIPADALRTEGNSTFVEAITQTFACRALAEPTA